MSKRKLIVKAPENAVCEGEGGFGLKLETNEQTMAVVRTVDDASVPAARWIAVRVALWHNESRDT